MKKSNLLLGVVSTILVSSFVFGSSNNLNPNLDNNERYMSDEVHVSTFDGLKSAMSSSVDQTIVFDNDIDLSNFVPGNSITNNKKANNQDIIIDGNGYGFVNKPSEYYTTSIFNNLEINHEQTVSITFRNLTLDNVGSFIGYIQIFATTDYDALFSNPSEANLIGKGITFQNITVKNNVKKNQTFYLTPYQRNNNTDYHTYQLFSFFVNNILLYHSGYQYDDEALTFNNIVIEDNHIDDNNFYIKNNSSSSIKPSISESFLSNLEFLTCGSSVHYHHSFVTYEYIYIKNNSFTNNTFKNGYYSGNNFIFTDFDSSIFESFGSLSGNANGLKSQVGTSGNYLYIRNIYLNNNQISESKKVNADGSLVIDHYNYSELISNSNYDLNTQYISTLNFENIFIFNNESYHLNQNGDYELIEQKNTSLLNITLLDQNNKPNTWDNLNSKNFFVYGPMYDSSSKLRIFKDVSGTSINNINYGRYLFEGDDSYYELINILVDKFGIYGYQIDFDQIEENGQIKNIVSSISIVKEDHINIFYDNLIYENNLNISQVELSFRYYQAFDENQIVDVPYQISNLKIYNDQNTDQIFIPDEIIATSEQTYSIQDGLYNVKLDLVNEIVLTQELIDTYDLDNLYLEFDYSNDSTQKVSSSTILKLNPNELKTYFPGFPELNSGSSTNVVLIGSISASALFVILIILLIILILWLLKRRRINNTYVVQDGYYEYSGDPNYLDNQDYNQNLYSNDGDYSGYEGQDQNYDFDSQNYYEDQNYDYDNQDYYESQNYDYDNEDYYDDQNYYED